MASKTIEPELHAVLQQAIDLHHAGQIARAISLLQATSRRFPDSGRLWGYLGFLQREAGRLSAAVRSFQRATEIAPKSEKASLGLFFSLYDSGQSDKAFREMFRYMRQSDSVQYFRMFRGAAFETRPHAVSA